MKHYSALIVTSIVFIVCGILDQYSKNPNESIFIAAALLALIGMIISFFFGLIQQDKERAKEAGEEDD